MFEICSTYIYKTALLEGCKHLGWGQHFEAQHINVGYTMTMSRVIAVSSTNPMSGSGVTTNLSGVV